MASAADGIFSSIQENIYVFIDSVNFGRNGLNASIATIELSKIAIPAIAASSLSLASSSLLMGCGSIYLSLAHGIPTAVESRKKAYKIYEEIVKKNSSNAPQNKEIHTYNLETQLISLEAPAVIKEEKKTWFNLLCYCCRIISYVICIEAIAACAIGGLYLEFEKSDDKQLQIAQKKVYLATLTEIYWAHMIRIGVLQIGIGLASILSSVTSSPAIYAACSLTAQILGGAIGITYILRGGALIYRSRGNRRLAHDLRKEIQTIFNETGSNPEEKAKKIKEALKNYCTVNGDGKIDFLTEEQKTQIENLSSINDKDNLRSYVEILDRGLHKEIVKFEVGESLGWAMVVGGALTLVATFVSGGSSLPITMLISSLVFMCLEGTFALYDSSHYFDQYQAELYKKPEWLLNPEKTKTTNNIAAIKKSGDALWYLSRAGTALPRSIHYLYELFESSPEPLKNQSSKQIEN